MLQFVCYSHENQAPPRSVSFGIITFLVKTNDGTVVAVPVEWRGTPFHSVLCMSGLVGSIFLIWVLALERHRPRSVPTVFVCWQNFRPTVGTGRLHLCGGNGTYMSARTQRMGPRLFDLTGGYCFIWSFRNMMRWTHAREMRCAGPGRRVGGNLLLGLGPE